MRACKNGYAVYSSERSRGNYLEFLCLLDDLPSLRVRIENEVIKVEKGDVLPMRK